MAKVHLSFDGEVTACHRRKDAVTPWWKSGEQYGEYWKNGDHVIEVVGPDKLERVTCRMCLGAYPG